MFRRSKATGILFGLVPWSDDMFGRGQTMAVMLEGEPVGSSTIVFTDHLDRLFGPEEDPPEGWNG